MYENPELLGLGTHHDVRLQAIEAGALMPDTVGSVNLDEVTTTTGTPLGFATKLEAPGQRLNWSSYLSRFPDFAPDRDYPPCHRWFPRGSWPAAIEPPPEGSLDADAFVALVEILADASKASDDLWCFAFYAALPANDFDEVHLWQSRVEDLPALLIENGGEYAFTPTNIWPADRSWFVWTDYDLQGTRISGRRELVYRVEEHPTLESTTWP
ncbi:MAG: hypothetical protein ACRDPS_08295 [Nocardioides sp.]|uniref:hypothetical protein n=1 Tax=Nocardioides sp. TaxID=35761 RepID=UPI003D6BBB58